VRRPGEDRRGPAGVERLIRDGSLGFVEKMARLLAYLAGQIAQFGPVLARDLQRAAPAVWQEVHEFRQDKILKNFRIILESGRREGYFRADVDLDLLLRMFLSLVQQLVTPRRSAERGGRRRRSSNRSSRSFSRAFFRTKAGRSSRRRLRPCSSPARRARHEKEDHSPRAHRSLRPGLLERAGPERRRRVGDDRGRRGQRRLEGRGPGPVALVQRGCAGRPGRPPGVIDHASLDIQLRQAEAGVRLAEAQLALLVKGARSEDIRQAEAALTQADSALKIAGDDAARMRELFKTGSVTSKQRTMRKPG